MGLIQDPFLDSLVNIPLRNVRTRTSSAWSRQNLRLILAREEIDGLLGDATLGGHAVDFGRGYGWSGCGCDEEKVWLVAVLGKGMIIEGLDISCENFEWKSWNGIIWACSLIRSTYVVHYLYDTSCWSKLSGLGTYKAGSTDREPERP